MYFKKCAKSFSNKSDTLKHIGRWFWNNDISGSFQNMIYKLTDSDRKSQR